MTQYSSYMLSELMVMAPYQFDIFKMMAEKDLEKSK